MPERKGIDRQLLCITDKANFHAHIDDLGENGIALLVTQRRGSSPDIDENELHVSSYGEGRETEFLGLLGYATVILHRNYFRSDDDE